MAIPHDPLSLASRLLKNAAPREWDNFVTATARYASEVLQALPDQPNEVHVRWLQGRAQGFSALIQLYQDCDRAEPAEPPPPPPMKEPKKVFSLSDLLAENPVQ